MSTPLTLGVVKGYSPFSYIKSSPFDEYRFGSLTLHGLGQDFPIRMFLIITDGDVSIDNPSPTTRGVSGVCPWDYDSF